MLLRMRALCLLALIVAAGTGCNGEECVEVDLTCAPLYEPTFENVFEQTLVDSCGIVGPCHNASAARAGLVFEDIDESYQLLMENERVLPFDADCSLLVKRIESTKSSFVMPPGGGMADAEKCAIEQWIANGAER
jgi:hypothetical protein